MKKKTGKSLAKFYQLGVRSTYWSRLSRAGG
jgi:hypothetical protein